MAKAVDKLATRLNHDISVTYGHAQVLKQRAFPGRTQSSDCFSLRQRQQAIESLESADEVVGNSQG
jgi:hypothetical protein